MTITHAKKVRVLNDIKLKDLADSVGMTSQAIIKIEKIKNMNEMHMSYKNLNKIASYFGMTVDEYLGVKPNKSKLKGDE